MLIEINNKFNIGDEVYVYAYNEIIKTKIIDITFNQNVSELYYSFFNQILNRNDYARESSIFSTEEEAKAFKKDQNISRFYKAIDEYKEILFYFYYNRSIKHYQDKIKEDIPNELHPLLKKIFELNDSISSMYNDDGTLVSNKCFECSYLNNK